MVANRRRNSGFGGVTAKVCDWRQNRDCHSTVPLINALTAASDYRSMICRRRPAVKGISWIVRTIGKVLASAIGDGTNFKRQNRGTRRFCRWWGCRTTVDQRSDIARSHECSPVVESKVVTGYLLPVLLSMSTKLSSHYGRLGHHYQKQILKSQDAT